MESFLYGAETILREKRARNPLLVFKNDGDSCRVAKTRAITTYSSGPRGGMQAAQALAAAYGFDPLVSMDVGGTTTDIGMVAAGSICSRRRGTVEGVECSVPLSDIVSIGAGGGSIFRVRDAAVVAGPGSVGALPGPACFGRGGQEPTITDAFLLLGILDPNSFFGGRLSLDGERAKAPVQSKIADPLKVSLDDALFLMEEAFSAKIAEEVSLFLEGATAATLAAFGGGGPMVACRVAEKVGIKRVVIPGLAAVFSAYGIEFSDIAHRYERMLNGTASADIGTLVKDLEERAARDMFAEGFELGECRRNLRLIWIERGESRSVELRPSDPIPREAFGKDTEPALSLRVVRPLPHAHIAGRDPAGRSPATFHESRRILLRGQGWQKIPLLRVREASKGATAEGPFILEDPFFTGLVPQGWTLEVTASRDLILERKV